MDGDHFLIRYRQGLTFRADPQQPAQAGVDAAGRAYTEEWGWLGTATDPRRRYVRRLLLVRPGAETVLLVTDLLDAAAYPAVDLLAVYLLRWQIETVFQQITEVFALRHLIGGTPQATVFQAALCLVIYNLLQLIRGDVAASCAARAAPLPLDELSTEQIFADLHEELVSLHRVVAGADWPSGRPWLTTAEQLRARLRQLLAQAWSPRWRKAKDRKPRLPQTKA